MSDLITKARKEWCEPPVSETTITHYGTKIITTPTGSLCPRSVITALLDVLDAVRDNFDGMDIGVCLLCGQKNYDPHMDGCAVLPAEAAIEKALEEK